MRISIKSGRRPRIEMLPLIDIVFLLLVFFIYAMLSMAVHKGLPVALPSSSNAMLDKGVALSVTLRADGSLYLDEEKTSLKGLGESLKKAVANGRERSVLLFADKSVSYQELFKVMDQIRSANITRISLQAEVDIQP
ncbi:ExbD/TolR family protein [Thermodesulfobacteriota bacterium]